MTAMQVQQALKKRGSAKKAKASAWFFKTGKGQYGYGDQFRGVTVPEQHQVAKQYKDLPVFEIDKLLKSPWHEDRLTGVFILVQRFQKSTSAEQKKLTSFYLQRTSAINNWDIVDSSAAQIVGNQPLAILKKLAKSKLIWDRRIAMIATYTGIKQGNPKPALTIATLLLKDKEDLMHKAVGWMLREVGERCSKADLIAFLRSHAATMPRTALRYAIEHLSPNERRYWLTFGR
ncbi:MAG: DNA alkylation repair protein [Candidatus Kerfeldbacteria bacterium]|nr:DNA alkylation repair protein [Candidatus Kerfeldbacteria bacterium]